MKVRALGLVFLVFLAGSCAVVQTTRVTSGNLSEREGIPYALPLGKLKVIAEKTPGPNATFSISCEEVYLPDPQNLYLLKFRPSSLADDSLQIVVSNGLLTSISSTNQDQTGELVLQLVKAGVEAMKLGVTGAMLTPTTVLERARIEETVNPFDEADWRRFAAQMQTFSDGGISVEFYTNSAVDFAALTQPPLSRNGDHLDGFLHRPLLPYTISFKHKFEAVSKTVLLPNQSPILSFNVKRSALVERVTRVRLEHGSITEAFVSKPSELLAAAKLPYSIIHSLVVLPTDLIQLRLNYITNRTAENNALTEYLKSELGRRQAEEALKGTNNAH